MNDIQISEDGSEERAAWDQRIFEATGRRWYNLMDQNMQALRDGVEKVSKQYAAEVLAAQTVAVPLVEQSALAAPAPQAVQKESRAAYVVRKQQIDQKLATTGATAYERLLHYELSRLQSAVLADAAALASSPVAQQKGVDLEPGWKLIAVNAQFNDLMDNLDRAQRKGYMPDAISEEWEAFDWSAWPPSTASPSNMEKP